MGFIKEDAIALGPNGKMWSLSPPWCLLQLMEAQRPAVT